MLFSLIVPITRTDFILSFGVLIVFWELFCLLQDRWEGWPAAKKEDPAI